jgi:ABC-type glycerol-3-phosphate transport system permease component
MREGQTTLAALAATLAASGAVILCGAGFAILAGEFKISDLFGLLAAWFFIWIFTCLHLLLAMPLYLLFRKLGWVNWGTAGLSGAAIGALPIPLLLLRTPMDSGGLPLMSWLGRAGLIGGLVFRAVLGRPEGDEA